MATKAKDNNISKPMKDSNPLSNVNTSSPVTENRNFEINTSGGNQVNKGQKGK